jgi:hypothetical protein
MISLVLFQRNFVALVCGCDAALPASGRRDRARRPR